MHYECTQLPGVFTSKAWSRFVAVEPLSLLDSSTDKISDNESILGKFVQQIASHPSLTPGNFC